MFYFYGICISVVFPLQSKRIWNSDGLRSGKKDITQPADERTLHFGGSILSGRVDLFDSFLIWHFENL